ncbi:MAG TPA: antitoxin VbhA family protein [Bryobacteraceae bacterium]
MTCPISEQERAGREQALVATIANLRIEDLHVDDELKHIFQRHVDGEIGDNELGAAIDELNEGRLGPYLYPGTDVLRSGPTSRLRNG